VSNTRREEDRELQDNLARFEKLKKQMTELSALSTKWAGLQAEMLHTEHEIALQLKEMGVHETACPNGGRSMGSCMTSAGVLLSKTCKEKENLVASCAAFAANMDSFMQTALEDLSASVKRYDATRRDYLSAEEVLNTSVSARKDPQKQKILRYCMQTRKIPFKTFTPKQQLEESLIVFVPHFFDPSVWLCSPSLVGSVVLVRAHLDEATNAYKYASWQVSQKVLLASHHRSRDLCARINTIMAAQREMHALCEASFSTWTPYKPSEGDALGVIEHCSVHPPPAPIISPESLDNPPIYTSHAAAGRTMQHSQQQQQQQHHQHRQQQQQQQQQQHGMSRNSRDVDSMPQAPVPAPHFTPGPYDSPAAHGSVDDGPAAAADDGFVEVQMTGGGRTPVSEHNASSLSPGQVGSGPRGGGSGVADAQGEELMRELGEQKSIIKEIESEIGHAIKASSSELEAANGDGGARVDTKVEGWGEEDEDEDDESEEQAAGPMMPSYQPPHVPSGETE
jgi:hypothetical protein